MRTHPMPPVSPLRRDSPGAERIAGYANIKTLPVALLSRGSWSGPGAHGRGTVPEPSPCGRKESSAVEQGPGSCGSAGVLTIWTITGFRPIVHCEPWHYEPRGAPSADHPWRAVRASGRTAITGLWPRWPRYPRSRDGTLPERACTATLGCGSCRPPVVVTGGTSGLW